MIAARPMAVDRSSVWRFVIPIALVISVFVVFMPALQAGYVDWDDDDLLLHNTRYQTFDEDSLHWMVTTSFSGHFQPLTWLSYTLDWALWEGELFGFHLTNVVLHILTTLTFYFIARRLIVLAVGRPGPIRSRSVVWASGFAAALFALHPLRVESVAWLAERRDVLSGFFYVVAVAMYLGYADPGRTRDAGSSRPRRRLYYGATIASCVLSLLAKASAVTLPLVLLILDVYPLRRWGRAKTAADASSATEPTVSGRRGRPRVLAEKLPLIILAVAAGIRALIAQERGGALYRFAEHDLWARLAQASYGLMFYLWKTLWPTELGPIYEIPSRDVLFGPTMWISLVVIVLVGLTAVYLRRRCPAVPAALAVYVVVLFPVLGIAQAGPQFVADRYSYLSCMGLALLPAAVLHRLSDHTVRGRQRNLRAILALASVALLVVAAQATFRQSSLWISPQRLWRHGIQVSPGSAIANTNYADSLAGLERFRAAARRYQRALELNPDDPVALHRLGDYYARFGPRENAVLYYLRALQVDPNRRNACFSLARLLVATGEPGKAVVVLRDGIQRHPEALDMIEYMARLLSTHPDAEVRKPQEALELALRVNRAHDDPHPSSLLTLASAYAEAGQFDKAVETAERALVLAEQQELNGLVAELKRRLALFREGKPYHAGE